LVSVSAHKMGGPPGLGALLVRRGLRLRPLLVGGDQERARRAGLENAPAIIGWGAASAALQSSLTAEVQWQQRATERLRQELARWPGITVFGHPTLRLPHIVCLGIDGIEPQAVLLGLDQRGIAAHSGSACASEDLLPSPVLEAMGVDAQRSLRLSFGWSSTDADIEALLIALPEVIGYLRGLSQ
jgi:cysteine desulfurase